MMSSNRQSLLFFLALIVCMPASAFYSQEVRDMANAIDVKFGSPLQHLEDDNYIDLYRDQINVATIMTYWKYTTHTEEGNYTFAEPDTASVLAEQIGAEMHGHPLVWGVDEHIPDWVLAKSNAEGESIMLDHISTVAGHFGNKIDVWDVVNEAIEEDGTYRDSYWNRAMTGEYIINAFRRAHEVVPDANLLYNGLGMETNRIKFDGIKGMLGWVQSENVGLSGLGWQLHVHVNDVLDENFPLAMYMEEISAMGLQNYITELDIRVAEDTEAERDRQRQAYKKITEIYLNNSTRGAHIQTWGLSDQYTWWNDFDPSQTHYPLPFDASFQKKPAYYGIQEAFAGFLNAGLEIGGFRIRNVDQNHYLEQSTLGDGALAQTRPSDPDDSNQQWTLSDGPDETTYFVCDLEGLYLNVESDVSGSNANVYTFNSNWWSMMWFLESAGTSTYRIKNRWSNLYLTASGGGVNIQALNQNSNAQLWVLEPTGDCLPNYILSGQITSGTNMSIQTSDWIDATANLLSGSNVHLTAKNSVELSPNFNAQIGSQLTINVADCGSDPPASQLVNPNANTHARLVYDFLTTYQDDPNECLILGQNLGWSFEMYASTVAALKTQTGHWPGVIGGQMRWAPTEIDYPALVTLYSEWQSNGGVVELSMLPDNPWTGGDTWDRSVTDIWKLTTPGETGYAAWRTQLDFYAQQLKKMENAGVTIVWRPLMEMNGDWFWYGYTGSNDAQPFINLFRDMYDYFTNTWQLNNLIWVYSANMAYSGIPDVDHYYPGDDVVDITGLDVYQNNVALPPAQYQTMVNLGKPFALTEFGPDHNNMNGQHDYLTYVNKIRTDFPETIYALAWHDWPGHLVTWINNQNASGALGLPCVVGRDEMNAW